jgi:putative FmdB family regulatory protein
MPFYDYACDDCEVVFTIRKPIAEYKTPENCPECEEDARKVISPVGVIFKGDSWGDKNRRVANQMRNSRKKAGVRQEEKLRDGGFRGGDLIPNVGGERVDNWEEAAKLASSQGKSTAGYERLAAKKKSKTKKIITP